MGNMDSFVRTTHASWDKQFRGPSAQLKPRKCRYAMTRDIKPMMIAMPVIAT